VPPAVVVVVVVVVVVAAAEVSDVQQNSAVLAAVVSDSVVPVAVDPDSAVLVIGALALAAQMVHVHEPAAGLAG